MRTDRYYFNLSQIIDSERQKGNDVTKLSFILGLYSKNYSRAKKLNEICDDTNISNSDKQCLIENQDWEIELNAIYASPYLQQKSKDAIANAYVNISIFANEIIEENNIYMNNTNNFTKQGRKKLRQIAFDFNKATSAVCYEIDDICMHYVDEETKKAFF